MGFDVNETDDIRMEVVLLRKDKNPHHLVWIAVSSQYIISVLAYWGAIENFLEGGIPSNMGETVHVVLCTVIRLSLYLWMSLFEVEKQADLHFIVAFVSVWFFSMKLQYLGTNDRNSLIGLG